jgi:hypothetical protein
MAGQAASTGRGCSSAFAKLTLSTARTAALGSSRSATTYQGSASAFVDPIFAFASPADADRYTLQYAPGLISAVPEPSGFALGGIGLAAMAVAIYAD